jgi:hypothetical protein
MTVRVIVLWFALGVIALSHSAEPSTEPFAKVARSADTIVATLSAMGGSLVLVDSPQPGMARSTSPGESFSLRDGASLLLVEHHSSYRITCHLLPPPAGLQIAARFDARSFGGSLSEKTYFIKAQ